MADARRHRMPLSRLLASFSRQNLCRKGILRVVINFDDLVDYRGKSGKVVKVRMSPNGDWLQYYVAPSDHDAFGYLKAFLDENAHPFEYEVHVMASRPQHCVGEEMATLGLNDERCKMLFIDNGSQYARVVADWKPPLAATFDRIVKPSVDDFLFVMGGHKFLDSFPSYGKFDGRMLTHLVTPDRA